MNSIVALKIDSRMVYLKIWQDNDNCVCVRAFVSIKRRDTNKI